MYQNIRTTPTIMRNGTVILLYSKAPKYLASSETTNTSHTAKVLCLELENTKSLWKILIESEKITKILK